MQMNWSRTISLLGQNVAQCDGSIFWDNSIEKGVRTKFTKCRIGIVNLADCSYHSITLDRGEIRAMFDQIGLTDDHSRKQQIVSYCEFRAIVIAKSLYPMAEIESDSQSAVVSAQAVWPNSSITWESRADLPLAHLVAKTTPDSTGKIVFKANSPQRGWLEFVADEAEVA